MTRINSVALVFALALAATGCAGEEDAAGGFRPGVTTRMEAIGVLGRPNAVYIRADGSRIVTWARSAGPFSGGTVGLSLLFGPDDRYLETVRRPEDMR